MFQIRKNPVDNQDAAIGRMISLLSDQALKAGTSLSHEERVQPASEETSDPKLALLQQKATRLMQRILENETAVKRANSTNFSILL